MKFIYFITLSLILNISCTTTNKNKITQILEAKDLKITQYMYGGYAGFSKTYYHYKNNGDEKLLILAEDTDYQTFIRFHDGEEKRLKDFLQAAYDTHSTPKDLSSSCTNVKYEYLIKSNKTSIKLFPDDETSDMFYEIIKEGFIF